MIPIAHASPGKTIQIIHIKGNDKIKSQLQSRGISKGSKVQILKSGDPVLIKLGERRIAIEFKQAIKILGKEC